MCPFLMMSFVGLQSVIVAFPGHTHFLFRENVVSENILQLKAYEWQQYMLLSETLLRKQKHLSYIIRLNAYNRYRQDHL